MFQNNERPRQKKWSFIAVQSKAVPYIVITKTDLVLAEQLCTVDEGKSTKRICVEVHDFNENLSYMKMIW